MNDTLLNDFLLEAFPNPERKGCPDEKALKALAEDKLSPGNNVLPHVSSCSECYREFRHYRREWMESQQDRPSIISGKSLFKANIARSQHRTWLTAAAAVVLVCGTGLFTLHGRKNPSPHGPPIAMNAPAKVSVDLFDAVTTRGAGDQDTAPLKEVSLPATVVELFITLPRFSEVGHYEIRVSRDRVGRQIVASGFGDARDDSGKVVVQAALDLSAAQPGSYFLATVRGSDHGTYYYPLRVK